jgi:hypothetical protein
MLSETTGYNRKNWYDHFSGIDLKGSWNIRYSRHPVLILGPEQMSLSMML